MLLCLLDLVDSGGADVTENAQTLSTHSMHELTPHIIYVHYFSVRYSCIHVVIVHVMHSFITCDFTCY